MNSTIHQLSFWTNFQPLIYNHNHPETKHKSLHPSNPKIDESSLSDLNKKSVEFHTKCWEQQLNQTKLINTVNDNINEIKTNQQQILQKLQSMDKKVNQKTEENTINIHPNSNSDSFKAKYESLKAATIQIIDYYQNPKPRLHLNRNNDKINKLKKISSTQNRKVFTVCEGNEKYSKCIKKFIKLNEDNTAYPSVQWIENSVQQNEVIESFDIVNHERIPSLNGEKGIKSKMEIPPMTVIGEYNVKLITENDFEDVYYGTDQSFKINEYAFNDTVQIQIDKADKNEFEKSLFDEPPRKKRKFNNNYNQSKPRSFTQERNDGITIKKENMKLTDNKVYHTMNIIMDGLSAESQSLLCYVNDIRKDVTIPDPTDEDLKYKNVEFVRVYHYGIPKVFIVTTKYVKVGEELMSYFGASFYTTVVEKERFKKIQESKRKDVKDILKRHNVTEIDI